MESCIDCLSTEFMNQGLEKVQPGHLGQVDFPAGQVTLHFHLSDGQGVRQVVYQLNHEKGKLEFTLVVVLFFGGRRGGGL